MEDNLQETGQEKKKRKAVLIIILAAVLIVAAAFGVLYATGALGGGSKEVVEKDGDGKDKQKEDAAKQEAKNKADAAGVTDEATLRRLLAAEGELDIVVANDIEITGVMPVNGQKTLSGNVTLRGVYDMKYDDEPAIMSVTKNSSLTVRGVNLDGDNAADGIYVARRASLTYQDGAVTNIGLYAVRTESDTKLTNMRIAQVGESALYVLEDGEAVIEGGTFEDSNYQVLIDKGGHCVINGEPVFDGATTSNLCNWGVVEIYGGSFKNSAGNGITNRGKLTMDYRGSRRGGMIEVYNCLDRGIFSPANFGCTYRDVYVHRTRNYAINHNGSGATIHMSNCVIDGENVFKGLLFIVRGEGDIKDVTIRNGTTGMIVENKAKVTLSDMRFENIKGDYALRLDDSNVTASHLTFKNLGDMSNTKAVVVTSGQWYEGYKEIPTHVVLNDVTVDDGAFKGLHVAGKYCDVEVKNSKIGNMQEFALLCENDAKTTLTNVKMTGGAAKNDHTLKILNRGQVVMDKGTVVTGSKAPVQNGGGTLIMNDGSYIRDNTCAHVIDINGPSLAPYKGAIGRFVMNGGAVTDNTITGGGNNIRVNTGNIMEMHGGEIAYNEGSRSGGAVTVSATSTFIMDGGSIHDNKALNSAGAVWTAGDVYLRSGSKGSAPEIYNNHAGSFGGAMNLERETVNKKVVSGRLFMSAGVIRDNSCVRSGGAMVISQPQCRAEFSGGEINDNDAAEYGDGIWLQGNAVIDGSFHMRNNDICINMNTAVGSGVIVKGTRPGSHSASDPLRVSVPRTADGKGKIAVTCDNAYAAGWVQGAIASPYKGYTIDVNSKENKTLIFDDYYDPAEDMQDMSDAEEVDVSDFWRLKEEVESTEDKKVINVTVSDIEFEDTVYVPSGAIVKVNTEGGNETFSRADGFTKSFFDVSYGTGLILGDEGDDAIEGNGLIIDASSDAAVSAPVITGKKGTVTELNGVTLKNANSSVHGSGVQTFGDLQVNACKFENNQITSKSANGSAIAILGDAGSATIKDTLFRGNTSATNCGGALFNEAGKIKVNNSAFVDNTSLHEGGAFYQNNKGDTTFTECVFRTNKASSNAGTGGGAIWVRGGGKLYVTDCAFDGNVDVKDGVGGGAIGVQGAGTTAEIKTTNVSVTRKNKKTSLTRAAADPKTISAAGVEGEVSFKENKVNNKFGGAIAAVDEATVEVTGYTFKSHTDAHHGGAIYNGSSNNTKGATLKLTNCYFTENSADDSGAAVYQNIATAATTITGCEFEKNGDGYVQSSGGTKTTNYGGAVCAPKGTVTAQNTVFTDNKAGSGGAALFWPQDANAKYTIDGCTFTNNEATTGQGGAVSAGSRGMRITVNFTGKNVFESNEAAGAGSAINGDGVDLIFEGAEGSAFTNNTITGENHTGGAIRMARSGDAGSLTISGYTFEGNTSEEYGGAIWTNADTEISDCTFTSNTTGTGANMKNGGAIAAMEEGHRTVKITDSVFKTNSTANNCGGALFNEGNTLMVERCLFDGNTSKHQAGAFYQNKATGEATFTECIFTGNESSSNLGNGGGAIWIGGGKLHVTDCAFDGNKDVKDGNGGGAIGVENSTADITATGKEQVTACEVTKAVSFTNNTAPKESGYMGGAIVAMGTSTVSVTGYTFTQNSANMGGAVGVKTGATVNITGCTFNENELNRANPNAGFGGAVYLDDKAGSNATITSSEFTGNIAYHGGAIYNKAKLTVTECTFTGNNATTSGGAVYQDVATASTTISGSTFTNNGYEGAADAPTSVSQHGGAVCSNHGAFTVKDTTFTGNKCQHGGAALFWPSDANSNATYRIEGCTFDGNAATISDGGAIHVGYTDGSLQATIEFAGKNVFENNTAKSQGGAINGQNAVLNFGGTAEFKNNTAATKGGAINITGNSQLTLSGESNVFANNTATGDNGGAINSENATVTLKGAGSTFTGNKAVAEKKNGGAIRITGTGKLTVSGYTFTENKSGIAGGAIYSETDTDITDSKFTGNVSDNTIGTGGSQQNGGAIAALGSGHTVTITNTSFSENSTVTNCGGAIFNAGNTLNVTGCLFNENTSSSEGAAFYQNGGTGVATFTECIFKQNHGSTEKGTGGGAIWVRGGGKLNVTDCAFEKNDAAHALPYTGGGAIGVQAPNTIATITANAAEEVSEGKKAAETEAPVQPKTITACGTEAQVGFKENSVVDGIFGGAIVAVDSSKLIVTGYTFEKNNSGNHGGAIYTKTDIEITNCTFIENTTKSNGGAIGAEDAGHAINITDSVFRTNTSRTNCGGALFNTSNNFTVTGCLFEGNTSAREAAAFYQNSPGTAAFNGCIFKTNTSCSNGGTGGGAIWVRGGGKLNVTDCAFDGNKDEKPGSSGTGGGAIGIEKEGTTVKISAAEGAKEITACGATAKVGFTGNATKKDGGAIYVLSGSLTLEGTVAFKGNTADTGHGNAIYLASASLLTGRGNAQLDPDSNQDIWDASQGKAISGKVKVKAKK